MIWHATGNPSKGLLCHGGSSNDSLTQGPVPWTALLSDFTYVRVSEAPRQNHYQATICLVILTFFASPCSSFLALFFICTSSHAYILVISSNCAVPHNDIVSIIDPPDTLCQSSHRFSHASEQKSKDTARSSVVLNASSISSVRGMENGLSPGNFSSPAIH